MNIGHNSRSMQSSAIPESMQDIAEVLGAGIVFALIEHLGGTEIKVPYKLREGHRLEAIGRPQALMLCEYFPERKIHIPLNLDRSRLKLQVDELEKRGLKRREVARELGITQRHVRRLANKEPPDERQLDMFSDD
jgi:hypothetical protein